MRKALTGIAASAFVLGAASMAMAAPQPMTFASLPTPVMKTVIKAWPKAGDMTPLVWKLKDGAYRITVRTATNKLKEMVVGPKGKIQKG